MGTPEGGPYDVTPPRLLKATPAMGSTKQTGNKISLLFDEAIQILKQNETVIVSPPQIKQPKISVYGRMLTIELRDNLRDSTTYTTLPTVWPTTTKGISWKTSAMLFPPAMYLIRCRSAAG